MSPSTAKIIPIMGACLIFGFLLGYIFGAVSMAGDVIDSCDKAGRWHWTDGRYVSVVQCSVVVGRRK